MLKQLLEAWTATVGSDQVRQELGRSSRDRDLRRRRQIGAAAAIGTVASVLVALRQIGAVRWLPEPPGRIWDTDAVTTSRAAFFLGMPDGPVGAIGFALVLTCVGRLAGSRPGERRWARAGLLLAAGGSAAGAAGYLADMFLRERKLCPYCLTTAAAAFTVVALAAREIAGQ
jgi:uncharacterized membrane protein